MKPRSIVVMAGPSLPSSLRPPGAVFDWRPPAATGDVLALVDDPPARLCLIDGFFDLRPTVWHKELLLLMAHGTVVLGGSSIGALRAAELDSFGMVGIGAIYRAFRRGLLSGDDDVALTHGPQELGWPALTVPMVDIRATLCRACRKGTVAPAEARCFRDLARNIHYAERTWDGLRQVSEEAGLLDQKRFGALKESYVSLKQQDALVCLEAARHWHGPAVPVIEPPRTVFIRALEAELARERSQSDQRHPAPG